MIDHTIVGDEVTWDNKISPQHHRQRVDMPEAGDVDALPKPNCLKLGLRAGRRKRRRCPLIVVAPNGRSLTRRVRGGVMNIASSQPLRYKGIDEHHRSSVNSIADELTEEQ